MQHHLLLFGILADVCGQSTLDIECEPNTDALRQELLDRIPLLQTYSFAIAVDKKIISQKTVLQADAEIALLPPFSGG